MALLTSPPGSTLRAALRPRIEGHPPYAYSLGDAAIKLVRRGGLILEPWQQDGVRLMMACRSDGSWACYEYAEWVPRQCGKGALLEARALAGFLLLGEELIMWSAHEFKTSIRAFRRMRTLVKRLGKQVGNDENLWLVDGIPVKIVNSHGEEGFERLDTEAELKFLARSKGSGRGFSGDLNIIDETFAYTTDQQEALSPTMRARPNPQVIYTSTPPLNGDSGEVMYELRARANDGDFEELGYRDWGLADPLEDRERMDLDDRSLWAQTNPALGYGRLTEKAVRRDRKTMRANGGRGFARECLGMWPPQTSAAGGRISPKQWEDLQDSTSRRAGDVAIGVFIAPERDYAAIALYGPRAVAEGEDPDEVEGLGHARLIERVADMARIVPKLEKLREELDPIAFAMNTATYESLATELTDAGFLVPETPSHPWRGELLVINATHSAAACGHLIDAVKDLTFRVQPDSEHPEVLDDAALAAKTRRSGGAMVWSSKEDEADVSPVEALTAARYGYVIRSEALEVEDLTGSLMA